MKLYGDLDLPESTADIYSAGGHGLFDRLYDWALVPDDHFRSGSIPSGYSWISDGTFNGTPGTIDYSLFNDWMRVNGTGGPFFLAHTVSAVSVNVSSSMTMYPNQSGNIGWRVDDGTNSNYYYFILSESSGLVTITLYQSGQSNQTAGPYYHQWPFTFNFFSIVSGSTHRPSIYVATLPGRYSPILNGTFVSIAGWAASGWRSGIMVPSAAGHGFCDWFVDART